MATLTINLSNATVFAGGYRVKYRKVGTVNYQFLATDLVGSTLVIPNVEAGVRYEGTIEGVCLTNGVASYTNAQPFITP